MNVNSEPFGSALDLRAMRHLQVRSTGFANVWHVRLPSTPWRMKDALQERASLLTKLEGAFPYRALWLSDWATDDGPGWRLLAGDAMLSVFDNEITNGAWALFFFERSPELATLEQHAPTEPANYGVAVQALQHLGAMAGIWSWYDNSEWLLVAPAAVEASR